MMNQNPMSSWLEHKTSLTDKLKALAKSTTLQVLNHCWEPTHLWDQTALGLPADITVLHRDIIMWADGAACWYARTVLPMPVFNIEAELFKRLDTEPLGELIHHHPHIERTNITPYEIKPHMPEYAYLKQNLKESTPQSKLWGRLSTFTIHKQHDFYLLEIMLPGLLRYCE